VFDVDGVLVDTTASYNEAVVRTVQWLIPGAPVDQATVRLWKRSGDWNNDWDLAYGLYCWLRAPDGEPAAAAAARRPLAALVAASGARAEESYAAVQGIFEEYYNGTVRAIERYGVEPRVGNADPLAERERIMLEAAHIQALRAAGVRRFGVVTGRVWADWEQVAGRLPLPPDTAVATDEDGRKPDPAGLTLVLDRLGAGRFVLIGDTLNDLRMVQAYAGTGRATGDAVIRCEPEDEEAYRAAGATALVRSLDDLAAQVGALDATAPRY